MTAYLQNIHPVLPVKDVNSAIEYYCANLGFKLTFVDNPETPAYAGLLRDGVTLHLQWHHKDEWQTGVDRPLLRIYTDEVDVLYDEFSSKNVFHKETQLRDTEWGTREFGIYDPFSNGLIFYRDL
ncbi:glyoxalase superfamily protein [Winogradskyella aurantiaca]|uniref:glyoxalase superfamily protein n=1 Tax=Winogradskyella aurantiaca TaxID=2219558 RepID=UPI000E1DB341|nr:glyoxalase superfamily protein [Winogradskyella aurantiaca]